MDKLLGILPYIYLADPLGVGDITFLGVPDWKGRNHAPQLQSDQRCLQELSACFPTRRGLSTNKGARKALTYFLIDVAAHGEERAFNAARKAITLFRYALLRPDSQGMDTVESTYLYLFALPPRTGTGNDYRLFQGWLNFNQELWVSPKHQTFPPPSWEVDLQMMSPYKCEDMNQLRERFYVQQLNPQEEENVLLAVEWYNQSFLRNSLRDVSGRIADIANAFETLFQLPRHNKTSEFIKGVTGTLGSQDPAPAKWAKDFYSDVRSEIVHRGKPRSYLFQHPSAQTAHLSFLWSAQRIFRECLSAKVGLPRHIDNDRLVAELTPNEVYLKRLRQAGSYGKIEKQGLLDDVWKLRAIWPPGPRADIVWLGKLLLRTYKRRYLKQGDSGLSALEEILKAPEGDNILWARYQKFKEQFQSQYTGDSIVLATVADLRRSSLEWTIRHFVDFAVYALSWPTSTT